MPGGALGAGTSFIGAVRDLIGRGLTWAGRRVYGLLGFAIGLAILFAVTFAALNPPADKSSEPAGDLGESQPVETKNAAVASTPAEPVVPVPVPQTTIIPDVEKSLAKSPDVILEKAIEASQTAVLPAEPPEPPVTQSAPKQAAPAVVAKTSSIRSGRYLLQLSAVPTARSARREIVRLEKRLGRLLGDRKIIVVKAAPPGKPAVYRLRASSYESRAAARNACKQIRKKKLGCLVVRR